MYLIQKMILILVLSLLPAAYGSCDLECKAFENYPDKMKYTPQATGCENAISDASCDILFGASANLSAGSNDPRPPLCWQLQNANGVLEPNADMKKAAIFNCAKKCGYCCMTSDYTCAKRDIPNVPLSIQKICEEVTWDKCLYSIEYRPIYAFYCPNTCGFCNINDCIDAVPTCSKDPSICNSPGMNEFTMKYCLHTCGYCTQCPDTVNNCAELKTQGFCSNTPSYVKKYCGKTCGIC
uniref:ShKT domain-containing protein n=3 Tax=Caenorhabditis tropicalis TaxID=1561998 RepID=A0A1I7TVV0_9PELO